MESSKTRAGGLDLLRVCAVLLVFMDHYDSQNTLSFFGAIGDNGWMGVELFFVLSGFLIARQVFGAIQAKRFSIGNFYYRRVLRTFPNYLVILALYYAIPGVREADLTIPLWKFFTFTQNFGLAPNMLWSSYIQTWSLCVEEYFYLILPLLVLLLFYRGASKTAYRWLIGLFVAGMILRGIVWIYTIPESGKDIFIVYAQQLYYPSYVRLGGLLVGVFLGWMVVCQKEWWHHLQRYGKYWLGLGVIGLILSFFVFWHVEKQFFFGPNMWGYALVEITFGGLVIAAESPGNFLHRCNHRIITLLAVWSYAIYLTQRIAVHLSAVLCAQLHLSSMSIMTVISAFILNIVMGAILYYLIEQPCLKLRDRFVWFKK